MIKILFVCHGNICRSPMAACVMKALVKEAGVGNAVYIDSAATSREELGNPIYPPARRTLQEHGIPLDGHRATQLQRQDYARYDYLVGMDGQNIANMKRILGSDPAGKIHRLLDFAGSGADIPDPWYTGDFEATYQQVTLGCRGLLERLWPSLPSC